MPDANPYSLILEPEGRPILEAGDLLCFHPLRNAPNKSDVTSVFKPEAENLCKFLGLDPSDHIVVFDNKRGRYTLANQIIKEIKARSPKVTAFFCHGFTHYLQAGPRSPNHPFAQPNDKKLFTQFINALVGAYDAPSLLLYACSTGDDPDGDPDTAPGSGDDSFADTCRDRMCEAGAVYCRVMAHTNAGPATVNPHIKFFDGQGSRFGGTGASFLIPPTQKAAFKKLRAKLEKDPDFRFRFPFMTVSDIQAEVLG